MIRNVRVRPYDKGSMRGFASAQYHDMVIKNIRIVEGKNGLFIGMPQTKVGDKYEDICFLMNQSDRDELRHQVISEYLERTAKRREDGNYPSRQDDRQEYTYSASPYPPPADEDCPF